MKTKDLAKQLTAGVLRLMEEKKLQDPKVRDNFLKHYVGEAFEREASSRIKSRFHGEVSKESEPGITLELYYWGRSLTELVGLPAIEQILFDRITERAIVVHNENARSNKAIEESSKRAKRRAEQMAEPTGEVPVNSFPETITLGHALGVVE